MIRINISEGQIKLFKNLSNLRVKILRARGKTTDVVINGGKLTLPYPLSQNKSYTARISGNSLEIVESKEGFLKPESARETESADKFTNKKNDSISPENAALNFILNDLFKINIFERNKQKKFVALKEKNNNIYFFVFDTFFYNARSKIILKIDNLKNVTMNVFIEDKNVDRDKIFQDIESNLSGKFTSIKTNISFLKETFLKEVSLLFKDKSIDIKV
ncbi:MAG TPA: hypothetical protein PK385_00745 [Spirochaetota bacterium]|nr:hypothetical protein [Spirochaetota bacterium]HOS31729.1 hypothetical protein [Spirochaetota bacterium]HOS54565.1 hypothetical protein [Spirochaetota bacterium]HPK61285.1 hypothetical protein [Spirochaetota bacterium]HQF77207.1 hypothetical protein [Spirochaetota bacterium]